MYYVYTLYTTQSNSILTYIQVNIDRQNTYKIQIVHL